MNSDVFAALESQTDRLDGILSSLNDEQRSSASLCPGWTVADVVLHLAQTEEGVTATIEGRDAPMPVEGASKIDEAMDQWVRAQRGAPPADVHARWNEARRAALDALKAADPSVPLLWAAAPLRPKTLATTRLSEHWIHTMDIADPLGIENPDTDDIHHLAWLAIKTIPYAFARAGRDDTPTVRAELVSPAGERWTFGPEDAECTIIGPASEFVRVAARRMSPEQATQLVASGAKADDVLLLVRTYA